MNWLATMIATLGFAALGVAHGAEYPSADHGGANLTLADGDVIWGVHTGIGNLTIPAGVVVKVEPYDGSNRSDQMSNTQTGTVRIEAESVNIEGVLTADSAGYSGAGGAGGSAPYVAGCTRGEGGPGRYQYSLFNSLLAGGDGTMCCGFNLMTCGGSCCGGFYCGGGSLMWGGSPREADGFDFGYSKAAPGEWWRACGGYMSGYGVGMNSDTTTDEKIIMGSGGAGSHGGFGGGAEQARGDGGASGGNGGGSIALVARLSLSLGPAARISAEGDMGRGRVPPPTTGCRGADGAATYPPDPALVIDMADWTNSGGAGAGGGILLQCKTLDGFDLQPGATISNLGGGGLVQNGGTVKLFYIQNQPSTIGVTIQTGRLFLRGGVAAASSSWQAY